MRRARRTPRAAILFRAHAYSPGAASALRRLVAQAGDAHDVWLVGFCRHRGDLDGFGHARTRAYDVESLCRLPYPARLACVDWARPVGHNDLPVMRFFHEQPAYERYWVVEHDVRYTGDWARLLSELSRSPADLLGTTIQTHADNPRWAHWPSLCTGDETTDPADWIKAFMPFARLSQAALEAIDRRYRRGWTGHQEATWPTIVGLSGLTIEDIGGVGRFVRGGNEGRYYWNTPLDPRLRPGSFVFRPTMLEDRDDHVWTGDEMEARDWVVEQLAVPGQLVHPVKD